MRAVMTEDDKARERVRAYLRQSYAECAPGLDRNIPLGKPSVEDANVIRKYFERKHRRGEYGRFFPLHEVANTFGVMRPMRRRDK